MGELDKLYILPSAFLPVAITSGVLRPHYIVLLEFKVTRHHS